MSKNRTKNFISLGLIVGTIAGAAGAFFLAPQKGVDTKKNIAKKLNHLTQKIILKAQDALINFEVTMESNMKDDEENFY